MQTFKEQCEKWATKKIHIYIYTYLSVYYIVYFMLCVVYCIVVYYSLLKVRS